MKNFGDLGTSHGSNVIKGQNDPLLLRQAGKELGQCLRGHGSKVTELGLLMRLTQVTDTEVEPPPRLCSSGATPAGQVLQSPLSPSDRGDREGGHKGQRDQG